MSVIERANLIGFGKLRNFASRWVAGLFLAVCMLIAATVPAAAQTITGATQSTSTYSGAGQTITYTVTVNSGNRVATSATVASNLGVIYSCPIADTVNTGVTFTCTGTYTTTAADVSSLQIQERATVTLLSFATPTIMTGPILTATYVAPPAPTVTSLSPATGPEAGGTSVTVTGTNFTGATAVSFGATPATSFTINSATSITAVSPAGTGTVNVRVTTGGGTSATGTGNAFVYAAASVAPAITQNPTSQVVTAGNSASFTAAASGTPTPTVQWQVSTDGGASYSNVAGATSTTLSFTASAGDNGKLFRAVFTNTGGTAVSTAASLSIQTVPVITTQPVGGTAAPGQGISMSAAATGTPTPTAQWLYSEDNGATFINLTNSLSFTLVSPTPKTVLMKVVFTNSAGSVTSDTVTLIWAKQNQTISFTSAAPTTAVVGGPTYTVTATATSGLPVSFAVDASATSVCSVSGATVSFIGVGTCTINANQAGNSAYNAAPQVQQAFAVGQGANVITFPSLTDTPFTSTPPVLSASASSGLAVSYVSNSTGVCTVAGGTITHVAAGTCSITASQDGNATYAAATPVTQTYSVTPGVNTITFPALPDTPFTSTPPVLSATASSGLAVSYASNSTGVCTVAGGTISFVAAGTCSITASQAGNASYAAATPVTQTFAVTPGVNTITFAALPNRVLGSGSFTLSATASSGLAVSYTTTTGGVCSVSGSTVSLLAVGTCTILANQAGDANFQAAAQVSQSFQVTKAVSTVSLTSSAGTVYFGMPVTLTATVTGVSPTGTVSFSDGATLLGTAPLTGNTATLTVSNLPTGARQLTATYQGDASNLPATSGAVSVTVSTRPNPAADPQVQGTVDTQFRTNEMFARTQMNNIGDRLDQLHGDGEDQDSIEITFSQPRPRLRSDLPGADMARQSRIGMGMGTGSGQPGSLGDAAWMPGGAPGMAPAMGDAAVAGESAASTAAPVPGTSRPVHIWASGDVSFGKQLATGSVETRFTTTGLTVGMDAKATDGLKLGVAFGFAWDNTRIGTTGSESDATNASLAFYGSYRVAPKTFVDLIVGTGYGTSNSTRVSSAGQVTLEGKRRHRQMFAALIVTVEARAGRLQLAPYVKADGIWVRLSPYTETGSPFWALSYQAASEDTYSLSGGMRLRYPLDADGRWLLTGRAEYRARVSGDYIQLLDYADIQGAQGSPYAINGTGVSTSTFTGGIGLEGQLDAVALRLNYDITTLSGRNVGHTISGGLSIRF